MPICLPPSKDFDDENQGTIHNHIFQIDAFANNQTVLILNNFSAVQFSAVLFNDIVKF